MMPVRRWSITTATAVADEARYVRIGWTDPALEGVPAQFELPERVLADADVARFVSHGRRGGD